MLALAAAVAHAHFVCVRGYLIDSGLPVFRVLCNCCVAEEAWRIKAVLFHVISGCPLVFRVICIDYSVSSAERLLLVTLLYDVMARQSMMSDIVDSAGRSGHCIFDTRLPDARLCFACLITGLREVIWGAR